MHGIGSRVSSSTRPGAKQPQRRLAILGLDRFGRGRAPFGMPLLKQ